MATAANLVREARTGAGLTMRGLASLADVAPSTVARIERGHVDPTLGMLARLLEAAGQELELGTHPAMGPKIGSLIDAWKASPRGDRPDWTRLRAFLDQLALHPEQKGSATLRMPAPSGSALLDNLLAGMSEKICDDAGLPRPHWTSRVPALLEPWTTPGTLRVQDAARESTPRQLSARGVTLTEESQWRDPGSVGV